MYPQRVQSTEIDERTNSRDREYRMATSSQGLMNMVFVYQLAGSFRYVAPTKAQNSHHSTGTQPGLVYHYKSCMHCVAARVGVVAITGMSLSATDTRSCRRSSSASHSTGLDCDVDAVSDAVYKYSCTGTFEAIRSTQCTRPRLRARGGGGWRREDLSRLHRRQTRARAPSWHTHHTHNSFQTKHLCSVFCF